MRILIAALAGALTLAGPALAQTAHKADPQDLTCGNYLTLPNSEKAAAMEALHIDRTGETSAASIAFATGARMQIAMMAECSRDHSQSAARAFARADRFAFD